MKNQPIYDPDDELLRKHLQGELSSDESEALKIKLDSDPVAREHFQVMEKIWKLSEGLNDYQSIDTEKDWFDWKKKLPARERNTLSDQSENGSVKDGAMIDGSVNDGFINDGGGRNLRVNPAFRFLRIAAAIVLLAISASLIYYYIGGRADQ